MEYENGGQKYSSRAVAQYASEDGQSYMMYFADFDCMSVAPLSSIFQPENVLDVYRVPPVVSDT